jgi:VWFA-related protein
MAGASGAKAMDQKMGSANRLKAKGRVPLLALAVGLALLGVGYRAGAQSDARPITANPSSIISPGSSLRQDAQQAQSIRVRVNLVSTPAVVHDNKGNLVLDLTESNFRILDNGAVQKVVGFEMGGAPVSAAIVIETSSRVGALLPEIQRTGSLFTQTVLGEDGEAAVLGYDDSVSTLKDFTKDQDAIDQTFTHLAEGTSGARLYDALENAVQMLGERPDNRRRILITIAEAVDTGSEQKLGQVLREAQLANITIYSIGLSTTVADVRGKDRENNQSPITPPGTFSTPPLPGSIQTPSTDAQRTGTSTMDPTTLAAWVVQHASDVVRERPLEVASAATGGLYQSTLRDSSITSAIDEISAEVHAQYTLTYRPTNTGTGDYHAIKVEIVGRGGMKVRSRPGYYLAAPQG